MNSKRQDEESQLATAVLDEHNSLRLEQRSRQMNPLSRLLFQQQLGRLVDDPSTVDSQIETMHRWLWAIRLRESILSAALTMYRQYRRINHVLSSLIEGAMRRLRTPFAQILRSSHYTLDVKTAASWLEWSYPRLKLLLVILYVSLGLYVVIPPGHVQVLEMLVLGFYSVTLLCALLAVIPSIWLFTKIDD